MTLPSGSVILNRIRRDFISWNPMRVRKRSTHSAPKTRSITALPLSQMSRRNGKSFMTGRVLSSSPRIISKAFFAGRSGRRGLLEADLAEFRREPDVHVVADRAVGAQEHRPGL